MRIAARLIAIAVFVVASSSADAKVPTRGSDTRTVVPKASNRSPRPRARRGERAPGSRIKVAIQKAKFQRETGRLSQAEKTLNQAMDRSTRPLTKRESRQLSRESKKIRRAQSAPARRAKAVAIAKSTAKWVGFGALAVSPALAGELAAWSTGNAALATGGYVANGILGLVGGVFGPIGYMAHREEQRAAARASNQ